MPSIDGLVTGIDSSSIIDSLLSIQQQQVDRLNLRKQEILEQKTSIGLVESRLAALQGSLTQLARAGSNAFTGRTVAISDESIISAATSNSAVPGNYRLTVNSLARSHQVKSNAFASGESTVQTGTYSIQVGNAAAVDIVIDDSNNTVSGLVATINDAGIGVGAAVIDDGSSGNSYRTLLTSKETGTSHGISVNFTPEPASTDTALVFDFDNPVQAATDASITIGSGSGAIDVSGQTNQIDEVIPGVTLDLLKADVDTEVSIDIRRDVEKAKTQIQSFVDSYNEFIGFVNEQFRFDPESGQTSNLFGNRSLAAIRDELVRAVQSPVAGLDPESNRLGQIGVTLNDIGELQFNASKFEEASDNGNGLDTMQKLFGISGESSNRLVRFIVAGNDTEASKLGDDGELVPYRLRVISAAQRGRIVGDTDLAATIDIDSSNHELTVKVDGSQEATIQLTEGSYDHEALIAHLTEAVNAHDDLRGRKITASIEDGKLEVSSQSYGRNSKLEIVGGSALGVLGLAEGDAVGRDVVAQYVFNEGTEDEYIEEVTGTGQLITGKSEDLDNPNATDGLQFRVALQDSQVDENELIDVTFIRGVASRLSNAISRVITGDNSRLSLINQAFDERVASVDQSIERLTEQFDSRRESLTAQFARLESVVGELQSTGNLLSAQLASIPQISAGI